MIGSAPPVLKLAQRLLLEIETAVRRFVRYHRYMVGADLRRQAMEVARVAQQAWRDRARAAAWVDQLVREVDGLKLTMQLAQDVRAFAGLEQFEALARLVIDLGRQVGGWHKQILQRHPDGQNAQAHAPVQRPEILSTRAASHGASR